MLQTLKKETSAKILTLLFVGFTVFWLFITFTQEPESTWHQLYANTYWFVALLGGIWGLLGSRHWGGFKSVMGKAMIFFSLGLLAQVFGQLSYSYYYYILHVEAPYPSMGDIGFFGSIPLYIFAVLMLAKASGVNTTLRGIQNKLWALVFPAIGLALSYFVFLRGYEFDFSSPLILFLDLGYPFGQAIYISLAVMTYMLSQKMLGGIMKNKIRYFILALVVQYVADWTFLYWTTQGTWYASGPNDLIYLISYFLMGISLIQLKTVADKLSGKV